VPFSPVEVLERVLDGAVEGRVRVRHVAQGGHRDLGADRDLQGGQDLAAAGPADVAPTSTERSASSITLMNPSLPALWIHPRAE
jgi:hypothetical protein